MHCGLFKYDYSLAGMDTDEHPIIPTNRPRRVVHHVTYRRNFAPHELACESGCVVPQGRLFWHWEDEDGKHVACTDCFPGLGGGDEAA